MKLDFDPAKPQAGSLDVTVETGSVDTQDGERDEILKGPDFFSVEKYPQAVFHADALRARGRRLARDRRSHDPRREEDRAGQFTLAPAGAATVMKGSASLKRLAFGLGQGDWASTEWVGDDVDVRFELKLAPVG